MSKQAAYLGGGKGDGAEPGAVFLRGRLGKSGGGGSTYRKSGKGYGRSTSRAIQDST